MWLQVHKTPSSLRRARNRVKCQITVQWCYTAAMQVSMFTCMAEQRLAEAIVLEVSEL